jgi:1-acyl-sn-glycerol-3-phosphate acyltransferase
MIRTAFVALVILAFLIFLGVPLLIYSVLAGETDTLYRVGRWGCKMVVRLAGIRVEIHGREKIPAGRAVVFMPNHQSNCDPPALISVLPEVLVLPKKEVFRIPILGRAMRRRGFIPVDRKNRERAMQAVEEAVKALRAGNSFLVYPEGTRSPDGRLLPFKRGAFILAIRAQVPIVPLSISGASRIMRKGEWAIHPGTLRITFHDPVPTAGYGEENGGAIIGLVRAAIISGLAEDEKPEQAPGPAAPARALHNRASGGRHEVAVQHGFVRTDVDGQFILYEHPEKGSLHTFGDGSWKHITGEGREVSGAGAEELEQRLSELESDEGSGNLRKLH